MSGGATAAAAAEIGQWPSRPIAIVNGYPAGGDADVVARLLAERMAARLGKPVIVENRTGASGTIAATYVKYAAPDGYTLLFVPSTFAIAQLTLKPSAQTAHDVIGDFTPIFKAGDTPLLAVTAEGAGYKDLKSIIADAKGGKAFTYGTPGAGSPMHLVGEMLNAAAGTKILHVPYRGVGPVINDALGGHIVIGWVTPAAGAQYVAAGKLVPLAVADTRRARLMPNVPTLMELGYEDVEVSAWMAMLAPKGLPAAIAGRLNGLLNEIIKLPDVVERMNALGIVPAGGAPSVLAAQIRADLDRYGPAIRQLGIAAD